MGTCNAAYRRANRQYLAFERRAHAAPANGANATARFAPPASRLNARLETVVMLAAKSLCTWRA
jgi:hypothetical protein